MCVLFWYAFIHALASRCRGAIIAHLLNLPASDVDNQQDNSNIVAIVQALDVAITEYCAALSRSVRVYCRVSTATRLDMATEPTELIVPRFSDQQQLTRPSLLATDSDSYSLYPCCDR